MWKLVSGSPLAREVLIIRGRNAAVRSSSTVVPSQPENVLQPVPKTVLKEEKINRAMKLYLEQARNHTIFLKEKQQEFELGKRHLANMMGWNPDNITQSDIDAAIEYLLPSGLFEKRARPLMKPPEEVFPKVKEAQFDNSGRPNSYLFYTVRANYYTILHDIVAEIRRLDSIQKQLFSKGVRHASEAEQFPVNNYEPIDRSTLRSMCVESINEERYDYFVRTLERLVSHPLSKRASKFILRFTTELTTENKKLEVPALMHDEAGNAYMTASGIRKLNRAEVKVTSNGTGKFIINGQRNAVEYFPELKDRIQVMFPLQFVNLLNKVDVEATIYRRHDEYDVGKMAQLSADELEDLKKPLEQNSGKSCEAGAIRIALSKALSSFVTEETIELMNFAGLLSKDVRRKERKKPGQEGARRKYTWRKR